MSSAEIASAVAAKPGSGFAEIVDLGFTAVSACKVQLPELLVYTPAGWINAQSINAKNQYLPFHPESKDTLNALTVITRGCVSGTPAGPSCDSITRVILLTGKDTAVEATSSYPINATWQNGFGATAACASLVSKFSMADVQKARGDKGEFLIVVFAGPVKLKTYKVKRQYLKMLGMAP